MVLTQQTNFVYISDLLKTTYFDECLLLTSILEQQNINYAFLNGTKNIWCKDYMPIQVDKNKFVLFKYSPSYLHHKGEINQAIEVCNNIGIDPTLSDIILDGSNLTSWSNKSILTDRIFDDNPKYASRVKLINNLEKILDTEVIIIPQIKSSQRGDVNSLLRFYDESTLIGNDRNDEYGYWTRKLSRILQDYQFNYIDFPFARFKDDNYWYNEIGSYINFLEVDNLIVAPAFGIKKHLDEEVVIELHKKYPNRAIESVNMNKIALNGGLLNSITWAIQV